MKILFSVSYPLSWARGGFAVQIQETRKELIKLGVDVSWVDYSSDSIQEADIVHYWGSPCSPIMWRAAQALGMRQVVSFLAPSGFFAPSWTDFFKKAVGSALRRTVGAKRIFGCVGIGYESADAWILLNQAEKNYVTFHYGWDEKRCHVIPNGVDDLFFDGTIQPEMLDGLLCPAYIYPLKNQIEIARSAKTLNVPVYFLGREQGEFPDYLNAFKQELDGNYAVWMGEVSDRRKLAALYRGARGVFLGSQTERQPLVLLESLACGTPVMGPGIPSLQSFFGDHIQYCPSARDETFLTALRKFDAFCRSGGVQKFDVLHWSDIARQVLSVYESVCEKNGVEGQ